MNSRYIKAIIISGGAWSLLQSGHEVIGHGLLVLIVGGIPLSVDAMYFSHDLTSVTATGIRWVQAGGSIFNVLLALGAFLILKSTPFKSYWINYFLWVTAVINLLQSGSYIAFGRLIHSGMDWAGILNGLDNKALWESIETIVGVALIGFGIIVARKFSTGFDNSGTLKASRFLFWIPLFTSATLSVIASIIMPSSDRLMMIMGGIGNGFIFLLPLFVLGFIKVKGKRVGLSLEESNAYWLLLCCAVLITFYLLVMSPGINF